MNNPFEEINTQLKELQNKNISLKWGTVTSSSPFQVKFDGETTSQTYAKQKNYTAAVNDRVAFLVINKQYICLGAYA